MTSSLPPWDPIEIGATFGALNCMDSAIASRQVEIATLEYVDWFNRRLFEACGDIPPAELEAAHYRQAAALTEAGHSSP